MSSSLLPQEVSQTLIGIVQAFASPDNNIRSQAESALNNTWITPENIDALLIFLCEQAAYSSDVTLSALSAVLFRKLAIRAPPNSAKSLIAKNITNISQTTLFSIRTILLQGFLDPNRENNIRHKLSDAIAECANEELPEWPELLESVFKIIADDTDAGSATDNSFKESCFRILSSAPHLINAVDFSMVIPLFEKGFTYDKNDDVKIAAVTAFVGYFKQLPKSHWSKLGYLLPSLLNSLPNFLSSGNDFALAAVFEPLIELVELAPKLFKEMFNEIVRFCDCVIKDRDLASNARTSALELLTVFSEYAPQMCKSSTVYGETLVMDCLMMMTEVSVDDEEALEWKISDDNDDDDQEEEYDHARQALDRVSLKLNGKYLVPFLFQYLEQMIVSPEWRQRFAALMALSSAVEGCRDVLMGKIGKILDITIPLINDPHPRVQYGACNALGQISTDFAPLVQRVAHQRIVPALISRLSSDCCERVQTHAAAALVNFSEEASQTIMEPYLDSLLSNLLVLLQSDKTYVQEQALTTIAFIANAAEKKFIKYYDTLMPLLINVLKTDTGAENRVLKGKCMECSTLIALAVGKQKFSTYSQELIDCFIRYQKDDEMKNDDPITSYLEHSWSRLCRLMREDFIPFLPIVLPPLIETAKASQDVTLIEEEEADNYQQYNEWDVVQIQGKHIAIHTSILDDKVSAMELIQIYASVLRNYFAGYVEEILLEIAIPSIDFYLHDGVRATGAKLITILLSSLISSTGVDTKVLELWSIAADKLVSGIMSEPMSEITQIYHSALADCIETINADCLTEQQVAAYTKGVSANLSDVYQRVNERRNNEDDYNEDVDNDLDDYADEDLLDEINKSLATIFKYKKEQYLPHFQTLLELISAYLHDTEQILVLFALVAIADMIQYCGEHTQPFKHLFINKVKEYLISPEPTIRQAASYIVGCCATSAPNLYADICNESLDVLLQVISIPDAKTEENLSATENASAAVAKILRTFNASLPNFNDNVQVWLKSFPIIQDEESAAFNYNFLCELIMKNHEAVVSKEALPVLLTCVVESLEKKVLRGDAAKSTINTMKQVLAQIPQDQIMTMFSGTSEEMMGNIQKWFG
ncbi:hypothetical protein ACO0RG_002311 [Hanseniaspora osmophila]|uniref:Importin subunit beta-3 n=1 Tax=Hanseniaspora osmophila TaxID=56408 RepID=A0A1E5RIC1_9ASCO|nr:Importin subunit beta-3 [Hanseniaspora osmophila]